MIRLLIATAIRLLANAVGLMVAAYILDDMTVSGAAFITAVLIFTVVENPLLGDVVFSGVTKVDTAKLEALFQPLKGDILNYNAIKEAVDKVQKVYTDAGYPLARVADMGVAPGGILQLRIAEGKIHAIKVSGNEETKEYVVRRELSTVPGEDKPWFPTCSTRLYFFTASTRVCASSMVCVMGFSR